MQEQDFIQIIKKHEKLERLLKEQDLGTLTDFKEEEFQNEEFKTYIEEDYGKSILTIAAKYLHTKKEGKVIAAMRSVQYLATPKAKEFIVAQLEPELIEAINGLLTLQNMVIENKDEVEITAQSEVFNRSLNNGIMSIFNFLGDHPSIQKRKDEYLQICIYILEKVAGANPNRETGKYLVFNLIINNIDKIKDFGKYTENIKIYQQKIEKKRKGVDVRYAIGIAVFIIIILWKLLRYLA